MSRDPYEKQPGDYEIRFLKDGRVVFVGPDQELLDLAQGLELPSDDRPDAERKQDDTDETSPSQASE